MQQADAVKLGPLGSAWRQNLRLLTLGDGEMRDLALGLFRRLLGAEGAELNAPSLVRIGRDRRRFRPADRGQMAARPKPA
jgi:hypothetical protein